MAWDTGFEQLPDNLNNPGYGADAIRELKSEISQRMDIEHTFSLINTASDDGGHKEGSGRVLVVDEQTRTADLVNDQVVGRVTVDISDLDNFPTRYGSEVGDTGVNQKNRIITVYGYDNVNATNTTPLEVFNGTDYVHGTFDQTVEGYKTFERSPRISAIVNGVDPEVTYDGDLIVPLTTFTTEQQKQLADLKTLIESLNKIMKSLLIGSNPDNDVKGRVEALFPGYYVGDNKINQTLKIKSIDADSITGATWQA